MPPNASRSPRRLFGGALACALDARFEDASTFMPSIPNHQEIFVDRARDETVIVELVDAIEDRTGSSLGAFAFEDACDACDAIEGARGDIVNERNKTYPDRALTALT